VRRLIQFAVGEVLPTEEEVLMRTGVPAGVEPSAAVGALLHEACSRIRRLARPRGVFQRLPADDFARVFRGDGRNAAETPLDEIVPRAEALALFVGTIGQEVADEIAGLFRDGDPALAVMLDAYASEMADAVATDLASRFAAEVRDGARVLPYSPGYCGWHVSGQRALFVALAPSEVGVTLKESCLMVPLKSVSGVLVSGDATVHRFRPRWAFCEECFGRECGPRMRSVR
jgi:hypothetical protein